MLERAHLGSPEELAAYYAGSFATLRRNTAGAPLNSDDRPIVEYRAPLDMVEVGRAALSGDPKVAALVPFAGAPPAGGLFRDWPAEHWYESRARLLMDRGDIARATATQRAAAAAGLAPLAQRLTAEIAAADRRARGLREVEQASELIAAGRNEEGRAALERAVEADPDNAHTWLLLADRRRVAGDLDGALAAIAHGQQSTDPGIRADAMLLSGLVALGRRRPQAALEDFVG